MGMHVDGSTDCFGDIDESRMACISTDTKGKMWLIIETNLLSAGKNIKGVSLSMAMMETYLNHLAFWCRNFWVLLSHSGHTR
jgi:hypothetical protein